jgi:hypothetical protein
VAGHWKISGLWGLILSGLFGQKITAKRSSGEFTFPVSVEQNPVGAFSDSAFEPRLV